ncbi:Sodium-coupled monocarboxylate transporter 2 [Holothuria leucospilota]|uniref:Sodium-coupled monocarboxylate transporter 2 n=1 Tax=Holothuria leucospilota TaxID=206669 RepID=A0A9Q0YDT7_HOLLE|nr:Sodium-coupled monocarboxylate transporter 2 [Holothuria leucospilota]
MAFLSAVDYAILVVFLLFSAGIGVFHALRGGRQRTAKEYLLADRQMNPIPVTISVVVSVLSAVTFLGTPAETYIHGPQYWVVFLAKVIPIYIIPFSFVPVFYKLQVTSIYEYLGTRFGRAVRLFGMSINCVYLVMYLGIVIYGPALALNAVTGLSIAGSIIAVGIVCTFYTTVGGIKAVLWADVFQSVIFLTGFFITIFACSAHVGGFAEIFRINSRDGHGTFLDFRLNPTIRHSFWSVFIGFGFLMTSYAGTNQIIVQRYMTCRTLKESQLAAGFGNLFIGVVELIAVFTGICMYAYFAGCDPVTSGKVQKADQLMAYIIIELFQHIPGMVGFLISAVFSASLSTISSGVNALATMFGQDVIKPFFPNLTDFKFTVILKLISVVFGIATIVMAFLASVLGGLLPLTLSLIGILNGPILGVFALGVYFPWANSKGAMSGMITALAIGGWMKIGALIYPPIIDYPPLFVDQCAVNVTNAADIAVTELYEVISESPSMMAPITTPGIARLYALSYAYYTPLTCLITIIVGVVVSFLIQPTDPSSLDPDLLSPMAETFCCCLPKHWREKLRCGVKVKDREIVETEDPDVVKTSPDL